MYLYLILCEQMILFPCVYLYVCFRVFELNVYLVWKHERNVRSKTTIKTPTEIN